MKVIEYVNASAMLRGLQFADEIQAMTASKLQQFHLNLTEALILISAFVEPHRSVKPSQVAAALSTSRSNVSHGISKLCQLGYLTRLRRGTDARISEVSTTPKGEALAVRLMAVFNELEDHFEGQLALIKPTH